MESKALSDLARKMGIDSPQVVKKAAEYSRLVSVQGSSLTRSLGLSGSAKSVICLELATSSCNNPVDKKTILRLSGMPTKKAYHHAYKTLECLLGREKSYTVHDLAVQFGVLEAAKLAESVFQRMQKIRVDKTKLLDLLGVKKSQFDKLTQDMQKISSERLSESHE
ncbi:origin recognition complex subunit 6-like isoform X2 [Actinia tenebrosa]|uniref:Origin recognition complex subunit 6-like isoform X2 n=1 Tax=Actinia tenebrosa TaxID=6105 RepID=A0A6P8IYX0_ACTTE|nr:origin recognition complex subunit 6-like isoform X2 [Actinia tenebrosa]